MTDITELAQSLKAAATNVKETAHIARYLKAIIARQTFKELMTPDNILALVEALEKAQQRITQLENYAEAEAVGADRAAEDGVYWMKRCKELESRTVKLPKLKMLEDYLAEVAIEERKQILVGVKLEFHRAITAAGIKVEAE